MKPTTKEIKSKRKEIYYAYSTTVSPLLPKTVFSNKNGYKLWLWGEKNIPNCDLKVTRTIDDEHGLSVAMDGRYYMSQPFMITRDISLPHDAAVVNIQTTMLNVSEKTEKITLWINSVPDEVGQTIYPVKSGIKYVQRRSVKQVRSDMLVKQSTQTASNFFAAPAQPWIARIFPQQKLVMAYVAEQKNIIPGGIFYTWHGFKAGKKITSLEMIFAPLKIKSRQSVQFKTRIMIFKGLNNLKTICGDVGIDYTMTVTGDEIKVKMLLNSVTYQTKLKMSVGLVPTVNSQASLLNEQQLPIAKLIPGENSSLEFTLPVKKLNGDYYLAGEINDRKFLILETITLK
ncbi:MAG: hypothetical protein L3J71_12475 [Victivallaceae bacterium]|nr:hypothetical protein [Victivallaceae bacterium]